MMAWIPTWETGFETQDPTELVKDASSTAGVSWSFTANNPRTGEFAANPGTSGGAGKVLDSAFVRGRLGLGLLWNSVGGNPAAAGPFVCYFGPKSNRIASIVAHSGGGNLHLSVNAISTAVDTFSMAGVPTGAYLDIGVQFNFVNNENGFVSVYLNGAKILSYVGAITEGVTNQFYFFDRSGGSNSFASGTRFDDIYLDVADGAEPDVAPPTFRIGYTTVNGVGDSSQWTPVGVVNNWQAVDDGVPDGDTTHVSAAAVDLLDLYTVAGITVPEGYSPVGVRPLVSARKTDSATDSRISGVIKDGATQAVDATEQLLPADYTVILGEYRATRPGGGAWTEAAINALQIGQMSKGTF